MSNSNVAQPNRFWATVTDEQLVDLNLEIDDPETLPGLVHEVPDNYREAHVEFKYDLRGKGIDQEFSCVHGHHQHKAGFVMKLGDARFMVGHICAKSIYGENFDQYTADIDAAIIRKDALRRVRELRDAILPFEAWLKQLAESDTMKSWSKLRGQLDSHLPFLYDNLTAYAQLDRRITGASLPKWLCRADCNPRQQIEALLAEITKLNSLLSGEAEKAAGIIGQLRARMDGISKRAEPILEYLQDVELFFQPVTLDAICKWANEHDNPKRRTYSYGLLSITLKNDKGDKTHILIPKGYVLPSKQPIIALRNALAGVGTETASPNKMIA
ncbi:hypothetical protein [Bradyrhizobium sp. 150]|uniref:hypothetical protein n=1 Tax=Bradyrhizobium sp. 150 TaxID=2782625 RepID=UPI001FF8D83E|nr:hypothetical protein [Bradyrhizobium sp. 150]MCK1671229.1 hypothetical protein [Bradyrhizobium sp. 150]